MRIDILTIFPEMVRQQLTHSIVGRAIQTDKLTVAVHDLRDWSTDKHRSVDDTPYGGGPGMVMKCQPIADAIDAITAMDSHRVHRIFPTPDGTPLHQGRVEELAKLPRIMILCGHYEGVDERIRQHWIDEEISLGDYVLTGGELPALILVDAISRLVPGVLGNDQSALQDSHGKTGLLDHPHYTKPSNYLGLTVPPILLSGNHQRIQEWRHKQALGRTKKRRADLWRQYPNGRVKSVSPEITRTSFASVLSAVHDPLYARFVTPAEFRCWEVEQWFLGRNSFPCWFATDSMGNDIGPRAWLLDQTSQIPQPVEKLVAWTLILSPARSGEDWFQNTLAFAVRELTKLPWQHKSQDRLLPSVARIIWCLESQAEGRTYGGLRCLAPGRIHWKKIHSHSWPKDISNFSSTELAEAVACHLTEVTGHPWSALTVKDPCEHYLTYACWE